MDFVNFGKIEVERKTFGSTIEFENVDFSRSSPNLGFHDTTGSFAGYGEIVLRECGGMMSKFRTSNTILMKSGAIGTDRVEAPKLRLEGDGTNIPVYHGAGDLRGIREAELYHGAVIITEHDSLKLGYLDWQSGSFANHPAGIFHIEGNPQGTRSSICLAFANPVFSNTLSLGPLAVVD